MFDEIWVVTYIFIKGIYINIEVEVLINRVNLQLTLVLSFSAALLSSCGLIFGGNQKVDNKAHDYEMVRLDRQSPSNWSILTPNVVEDHDTSPRGKQTSLAIDDGGDIAFEHKLSGSIISLNTVCREYREASLEDLTNNLLLGINVRSEPKKRELLVDKTNALETIVDAIMSGRGPSGDNVERPVKVSTVVMRKSGCTYDFMLIASPSAFASTYSDFERFLKGFHAP